VANDSAPAVEPAITYDDFRKVDIRVGTIVGVEPFGAAIGLRKSSAQIVANYDPATLVGRQVAAVVNFPPKQIGKFMSEVLVLGFPDGAGEVVMIAPDKPVPNGGRLY
jgi:tRNA-binding protein